MNVFEENKELFDLGSSAATEEFDPFAIEEETDESNTEEITAEQSKEDTTVPKQEETNPVSPEPAKSTKTEQSFEEKLPVFTYGGATEPISDTSKTFDELRIEKSADFPELEEGKRVSWSVEYGKITKNVPDPKGTSIGKVKSDIETSKEFLDSLKKAKDKNPICKVKPRVTAQSKGTAYKGVFTTLEEAEASGKTISIVPARDGKVYEIRNTEIGKFITPVEGCDMLSEVKPGFTSGLPLIPSDLMIKIFAFFRYFVSEYSENEALLNIYWDREEKRFVAYAPEQTATKVSVDTKIDDRFMSDRYIHYMDIHSHNTMSAFFSPVDDRDEKATRLYTVIGKLNEHNPEIKTRISNGGKFLNIDPAQVFEIADFSFPKEWEDNVHIRENKKIPKPLAHFLSLKRKAGAL